MRSVCLMVSLAILVAISGVAADQCSTGNRPPDLRADPATQLQGLTGTEFDLTYMRVTYQLHSDIYALADQAVKRTSGRTLRILSEGIRHEQMDINAKLAAWYKQINGGTLSNFCVQSNPDFNRLQTTLPRDYDKNYVNTMLVYLQRAKDAAQLSISRSGMAQLRDQAKLVIKAADRETTALRNWLNDLPVFN